MPLDTAESARWFKLAADDGIIAGQVEYAIMLFNGVGVDRDENEAAKIFHKAAARHNPIAQNRLAHLYIAGRGVPRTSSRRRCGTASPKPPASKTPPSTRRRQNSRPSMTQVQALVERQLVF